MKKFKLSIVKTSSISIALLLLFSVNAYAQKDLEKIKDAYAKKIITTKMPGVVDTETIQEIFFSKDGNIIATYGTEKRNISMANIVEEKKSVTIRNFVTGTTIIYDPEKRKGYETKIELANEISSMSEEKMKEFAKQMADATGTEIEILGKKNMLGYTVSGTRATSYMMGLETVTETWMLENTNFIMKLNSSGSGVITEETVIEFELGVDFDPKKLEVPSDVEIKPFKSPF